MQNKTDKGTSLVSKSLPVANLNSVNHLFSATKTNDYVLCNEEDKTKAALAVDDIDMALGNKIPLWAFGFLY